MKRHFQNVWFSFPFQLLVVHVKYHILLTAIWILLGSFITGSFASSYGAKYLFWAPEYLGNVDFWSFFFLGLGFGSLTITWNLTTYLLSAHRFPFLASLSRPFTKFCLNNFILPVFFVGMIIFFHIQFEIRETQFSYETVIINISGFLFGVFTLLLLLLMYFIYTNKNIFAFTENTERELPPDRIRNIGPGRGVPLEEIKAAKTGRRVDYYLTESFAPRRVRSVAHYSLKSLQRVFKQNHTNALMIQMLSLVILVGLGLMIDRPAFRIPAGASVLLLASTFVAVIGAIIYWFHRWSFAFFIGLFLGH